MEITKSLQDDIVKIQNELITAIQNHQVLVNRQKVIPSESIKTQIEEVQRHIICLGESQKILVTRIRNELESQSLQLKNNKHKASHLQRPLSKSDSEHDRFNNKLKSQELGRSLLVNNVNNRERSLLKTSYASDNDSVSDKKILLPKIRHISVDSSSEENRTPCCSPINGNGDIEQKAVKRTLPLPEPPSVHGKRPKTTLQATPRPTSPVPARTKEQDGLSSFSEESLDSLMSQQPESETKKIDFALALGLVTKEVYGRIIKKKNERRQRKSSVQQTLYNDQWDLTVLQKRSRLKEPGQEDDGEGEDGSRDCATPQSDSDGLCFACLKPGELRECRVCHTGCHVTCVSNDICPACLQRAGLTPCNPLITEKKKELEQLRLVNKDLHKSVSKLRERAKVLSASLVMQTATVNQMVAKEDQLLESIQKLKDFVSFIQTPPEKAT